MNQVALQGADYVGLKAKVLVEVGQQVGLGERLLIDKCDPAVAYTSPGSGCVVAINRGRRRVLQSVVIELNTTPEHTFSSPHPLDSKSIRALLLQSGLWTAFRTRPYDRVAHSASTPRSIFITAIDTRPLAPDPAVVIAEHRDEFKLGLEIISRLGDWPVYLCTGPNWSGPEIDSDRFQRVEFDGPHPAGLPGTHIHHLDPVAADRMVWHLGYQDTIAIGHLFKTGRLSSERIVSIAGPCVVKPRLVRTRLGASIIELVTGEVPTLDDNRLISGSVLEGVTDQGYLGRYHNQVSVLPEKAQRRLFGWMALGAGRLSRHRGFTTACHGRIAAMLPANAFERVMPLDVLPVPLLRAILVKDTDTAQALGCLELTEEDLALSSFVCPGKQDYGAVLRINLQQIETDG